MLKTFLEMQRVAMSYLVHDLNTRADECGLESEWDFATVQRHHRAIHEALQRFHRMTTPLPISDTANSIRVKAADRITDFYNTLRTRLPNVNVSAIGISRYPTADWEKTLEWLAGIVRDLATEMQSLVGELDAVLQRKEELCGEVEVSRAKMAGIL